MNPDPRHIEAAHEPRPLAVDSKTAAALLGISPRKLWSLTNAGDIPSFRVGRAVRYRLSALESWMIQREKKGGQR